MVAQLPVEASSLTSAQTSDYIVHVHLVIGTPLHTRDMYSRFVKGPSESKRLFSLLDVDSDNLKGGEVS